MNVLVLGGTRFFGIHIVNSLLSKGHNVTIATRGKTKDVFGQNIERLFIERTSADSLSTALSNKFFDVVCDNRKCFKRWRSEKEMIISYTELNKLIQEEPYESEIT